MSKRKKHMDMADWFLFLVGFFIIMGVLIAIFDPGREPSTEPLDQKIASKIEQPIASVKILSVDDGPFQFLGTKGTKYKTRMFKRHPKTGQKGHWMQITVREGSLRIKNGNNSITLESSKLINLDALEDFNDLD